MAWIYLPKKKKREDYPRYKKVNSNKRDNQNHKVYNTTNWRELRLQYISNNPLCERCLENDIIKSAEQVHHKIPISQGKTLMEKQALGYDVNNLMSVCKSCHYFIHNPF